MANTPKQHLSLGMAEIFSGYGRYVPPASARSTLQPWVLSMTTRGSVLLYDVENSPMVSRAGDCALIRGSTPQYWRVPTKSEGGAGYWSVIYSAFTPRSHWYPWLQDLAKAPITIFRLAEVSSRRSIFRNLLRAFKFNQSTRLNRNEYAMHALEAALLECWSEHLTSEKLNGLDPRIRQAVQILMSNSHQTLRLDQLARSCHLSRSQFCHLFRRQIGVTAFTFQERQRIEMAQRMLRMTFEPIRAIAKTCGFEDPHYFATRFKHETGVSPREYRKMVKAPPQKSS